MTRLKELRRIEQALLHRDVEQLRWAERYCEMRLSLTPDGENRSWRRHLRKVQEALHSAQGAES